MLLLGKSSESVSGKAAVLLHLYSSLRSVVQQGKKNALLLFVSFCFREGEIIAFCATCLEHSKL